MKYSSASGTANIMIWYKCCIICIHCFNLSILISFSFFQSYLKPIELKSTFSGFLSNNQINAVFPSLSTFPLSRCTRSTAHLWLSSCGLNRHKYIKTVRFSLSTQSCCRCGSTWNRPQLKLKLLSLKDTNKYIRAHLPSIFLISYSVSNSAPDHLASSSRNLG